MTCAELANLTYVEVLSTHLRADLLWPAAALLDDDHA